MRARSGEIYQDGKGIVSGDPLVGHLRETLKVVDGDLVFMCGVWREQRGLVS